MVSEDYEIPVFNEVKNVSDSQVQDQELTIKGAIFLLWDPHMATEESERLLTTIHELLKYCTHCCSRCIHCEGRRSDGPWVDKHC